MSARVGVKIYVHSPLLPAQEATSVPLGYSTYEAAAASFEWDDRWQLFDGSRDSFNIAHECLERHDNDATAVRIAFDDGSTATHTVGEIDRLSSQFANFLADRGVEKGDRVAIMLDPRLDFYATLFGTLKCGAVCVPMTILFGPDSIEYRLTDSESKMLVTLSEKADELPTDAYVDVVVVEDDLRSRLESYPETYEWETTAADHSVLQYTSGTTGKAKGTQMTHKSLTYTAVNLLFSRGIRPEDKYFCPSKPSWAQGIWLGVLGPLAVGNAAGNSSGRFDPEILLAGLEAFEITNMSAAPTVLRKIKTSGKAPEYDLRLERMTSSGERLDIDTQEYFLEELGIPVGNTYGVSEFGAVTMDFLGFDDWEIKPGSIGKPLPGLEVAVIDDDGEVLQAGETGEIAIFRDGDWFRTGDSGKVDQDGYFWHRGRKDDVIITAGYRVDPYEVDNAINKHSDVQEVAVVGSENEERTNVVKAFVKTSASDTDALAEEIKEMVKAELGKHKYPREIEFVDEFPRTKSGDKIRRKDLT
jgi:acetyl-CoA synthetase